MQLKPKEMSHGVSRQPDAFWGCGQVGRASLPVWDCAMSRTFAAVLIATACLTAADGGPSTTPAPGFDSPKAGPSPQRLMPPQQPMMMPRPAMAFEVEMLTVKAGDASALALWAELAALGFHVVAAIPGEGQSLLLLERAAPSSASSTLRLPGGIDAAQAGTLRQRIEAAMQERQRAQQPRPPVPAAKPSEAQ